MIDEEFEWVRSNAPLSIDICPTCEGQRLDGGKGGRVNGDSGRHYGLLRGQYRFQGEIHECDCVTQMALYRHYFAANIGEQYMRLDWSEYDSDSNAKREIDLYLDRWKNARKNGYGLTLYGVVGVGKTFAATHIAKSLIKRGQRVYFTYFKKIISNILDLPGEKSLEYQNMIETIPFLVIDEVWWLPSFSEQRKNLFGEMFEQVIRTRTGQNLPTILTSNLSPDEFNDTYPRIYSLLEAKQFNIEMTGLDYRISHQALEKMVMDDNKEVRPIT